jgi:hypothetical protein
MPRALRESVEKIDHPMREASDVFHQIGAETCERDLL